MKRHVKLSVFLLILVSCTRPLPATPDPVPARSALPQVMVLGTYHMGGSGDYVQQSHDDVLSTTRQREILNLVDALAGFRPRKIMVEVLWERDAALNANYHRYLSGQDTLTRDEVDQIAFRLAERMGHDRIYAVDVSHPEDIGAVVAWAAQHGDAAFVSYVQRFTAKIRMSADSARELSIAEYLTRINSDAEDAAGHSAYLRMARVGSGSDHVGADVVAGRYSRNLRIFANISRELVPDDRVLVLYGAGHGKLLREFVREAGDMQLVDVQPYLRAAASRDRR